jgi:hypothetical protein
LLQAWDWKRMHQPNISCTSKIIWSRNEKIYIITFIIFYFSLLFLTFHFIRSVNVREHLSHHTEQFNAFIAPLPAPALLSAGIPCVCTGSGHSSYTYPFNDHLQAVSWL